CAPSRRRTLHNRPCGRGISGQHRRAATHRMVGHGRIGQLPQHRGVPAHRGRRDRPPRAHRTAHRRLRTPSPRSRGRRLPRAARLPRPRGRPPSRGGRGRELDHLRVRDDARRRGRRARPRARRPVVGGAREAGAVAGRTTPAAAERGAAGTRAARDRVNAATAWREALASWAIPQPILDAAPEPPWVFPVELFASRADASTATPDVTPSNRRALEALTEGGSVLDVGCGAGAASLPLARRARLLIGVDASADMLAAFAERADAAGVAWEMIEGVWPDAAATAPEADVVVCHHVAYNAPYLDAFARALTEHARRRVVMELTATHPLSTMNELSVRFHGLARPGRP